MGTKIIEDGFDLYQEEAALTALYPRRGRNLPYVTLGLTGESGEVAEQVKKAIRDDAGEISEQRRSDIRKELGDVLWYVAMAADELGESLGLIARDNLAKLRDRRERGTLAGSGDDR